MFNHLEHQINRIVNFQILKSKRMLQSLANARLFVYRNSFKVNGTDFAYSAEEDNAPECEKNLGVVNKFLDKEKLL